VLTVVQRWFTPKKRGLALGIISPGYGLGFAAMGATFRGSFTTTHGGMPGTSWEPGLWPWF